MAEESPTHRSRPHRRRRQTLAAHWPWCRVWRARIRCRTSLWPTGGPARGGSVCRRGLRRRRHRSRYESRLHSGLGRLRHLMPGTGGQCERSPCSPCPSRRLHREPRWNNRRQRGAWPSSRHRLSPSPARPDLVGRPSGDPRDPGWHRLCPRQAGPAIGGTDFAGGQAADRGLRPEPRRHADRVLFLTQYPARRGPHPTISQKERAYGIPNPAASAFPP